MSSRDPFGVTIQSDEGEVVALLYVQRNAVEIRPKNRTPIVISDTARPEFEICPRDDLEVPFTVTFDAGQGEARFELRLLDEGDLDALENQLARCGFTVRHAHGPEPSGLSPAPSTPSYCHRCGWILVTDAQFCSNCGQGVVVPRPRVAQDSSSGVFAGERPALRVAPPQGRDEASSDSAAGWMLVLGLSGLVAVVWLLAGSWIMDSLGLSDSAKIKATLAEDCSNLPRSFWDSKVVWTTRDGGIDRGSINGLRIMVMHDRSGSWDFGPDITDEQAVSLHDAWRCGGLVHFVEG